jgi:hypothetical protein
MIDHGATSESSTTPNGENGHSAPDAAQLRTESLEQRVRRLEEAVAVLQDTRHLEERVVERVTSRLSQAPRQGSEDSRTTILHTGRQLLPAALALVRAGADQAEQQAQPQGAPSDAGRPWLLFDLYAEARTMVHMFFDRRYRVTWLARVVPAALFVAILLSWIFLPGTSFLPTSLMTIVDKLVDLVLAFVAFKILSREVRRYREVVADLPPVRQF